MLFIIVFPLQMILLWLIHTSIFVLLNGLENVSDKSDEILTYNILQSIK